MAAMQVHETHLVIFLRSGEKDDAKSTFHVEKVQFPSKAHWATMLADVRDLWQTCLIPRAFEKLRHSVQPRVSAMTTWKRTQVTKEMDIMKRMLEEDEEALASDSSKKPNFSI